MVTELTYTRPTAIYMKTLVKIAHASSLLDAGRIKVGKSVVRARKGLLIGKAHARQHACAGSGPGLRVQMLTRAEPCSTKFIGRIAYIRRY
jgi:hypothetical protein